MKIPVSYFKNYLKEEIKRRVKPSYGKNELLLVIEEIYSEFIERYLEDQE